MIRAVSYAALFSAAVAAQGFAQNTVTPYSATNGGVVNLGNNGTPALTATIGANPSSATVAQPTSSTTTGTTATASTSSAAAASSGSGGGTIKLWNVATNQLLLTLSTVPDLRSEWYQLLFSPNGAYLACGAIHNSRVESEVIIWPAASPEYPVP